MNIEHPSLLDSVCISLPVFLAPYGSWLLTEWRTEVAFASALSVGPGTISVSPKHKSQAESVKLGRAAEIHAIFQGSENVPPTFTIPQLC